MTKSDSEFPDTRASLLLQLQAGVDQDGWQEFVAIYRPIIYRLARKRGLQDADAQDLAQQVLVSIAGAIERWRAASIAKTEVSADTWQVFQLTVIEGCAIEAAASRMSKSVGAAYAARGRVMSRLRRIVNEMERRES